MADEEWSAVVVVMAHDVFVSPCLLILCPVVLPKDISNGHVPTFSVVVEMLDSLVKTRFSTNHKWIARNCGMFVNEPPSVWRIMEIISLWDPALEYGCGGGEGGGWVAMVLLDVHHPSC